MSDSSKEPRFSFRIVQGEDVITFSACIPEKQLKNVTKVFWGAIGSGVLWVATQFFQLPSPQINLLAPIPPISTKAQQ